MNYTLILILLAYFFVAIAYGRYIYLRHTWKFAYGDEMPSAVCFGAIWPLSMLIQFALFLGAFIHTKTPTKG